MVKLEISPTAGEVLISIGGRLDADGAAPIWRQARTALAQNAQLPIRIDVAGVDYCDGAGLALLVDLLRAERAPGAGVEIVQLSAHLQGMLGQFDPVAFKAPLALAAEPASWPARLKILAGRFQADAWAQVSFIGEAVRALAAAILVPRQVRWRDTVAVAEEAGINALPIVTLVSFILGVIIAYQSALAMRQFGAEVYVADLIGLSMVRELAPLLTAILLAGRSGAAFAAELGTMRVNEEIDALTTFGFDPVRFLVLPRVLAALLVTPLLAIYADLVSILGGAAVLLSFQVPMVTYFNRVFSLLQMSDLLGGLFKCCVFGIAIAGIGCLRGLQTGTGAAAVGVATTRAVVSGLVMIVVIDGLFSIVYYHLGI